MTAERVVSAEEGIERIRNMRRGSVFSFWSSGCGNVVFIITALVTSAGSSSIVLIVVLRERERNRV